MIYHNKKSNNKIVHVKNCHYLSEKSENVIVFNDMKDALKQGYVLCKKCNPLRIAVLRESQKVTEYSKQNHLRIAISDSEINVTCKTEQWKIVVSLDGAGLSLYHKNTDNRYFDNYVPNYHCQNVKKNTIMEYLDYIVVHAGFRAKNPYYQVWSSSSSKYGYDLKPYCKSNKIKKRKIKDKKDKSQTGKNVLELLKTLYSEEYYKDFLCYIAQ